MGLDVVEMIIKIEEAFDIQIPDNRAEEILTVGDLYDFVLQSHPHLGDERLCLSASTFRLIRSRLRNDLQLPTQRLRPRDSVAALLSVESRRDTWRLLGHALQLRLPTLARPQWVTVLGTFATFTASIAAGILVYSSVGSWGSVLITMIAAGACGVLLKRLTVPLAVNLRDSFTTFRGFTHEVMARNYSKLFERFHRSTAADVWVSLRRIIAGQLGVDEKEVTLQASFVKDLGMD